MVLIVFEDMFLANQKIEGMPQEQIRAGTIQPTRFQLISLSFSKFTVCLHLLGSIRLVWSGRVWLGVVGWFLVGYLIPVRWRGVGFWCAPTRPYPIRPYQTLTFQTRPYQSRHCQTYQTLPDPTLPGPTL